MLIRKMGSCILGAVLLFLCNGNAFSQENQYIVYVEPVKMVPMLSGVPAYRGNLSYIADSQNIYTIKYSQFLQKHTFETNSYGPSEKPGFTWIKIGGALRRPSTIHGWGSFYESDLNFAYWHYYESIYEYQFTGIQTFLYGGFNYLGDHVFFSTSIGAGVNWGLHQTHDRSDADNEAPPKILSNPPITLLSPYIPVDLEISLGWIF